MENTQDLSPKNTEKPDSTGDSKINESGSFLIEGFIKITDPNTKEVLVETRA